MTVFGASAHLAADSRLRVRDIPGLSGPLITVDDQKTYSGDVNIFFADVQQLSALGQSISDYLANRFAMAPEVEAVA